MDAPHERFAASGSQTDRAPLAGRVTVVTGGSRGLGLAIAEASAAAGSAVALLDQRADVIDVAPELAARTGARVIGATADVTSPTSVEAALDLVEERLGLATCLVNAAGIADGTSALDVAVHTFRRILDVNLTGTFIVCRAFARRVIAADAHGTVVNIASMSGQRVNRPQDQAAYNASKAGVVMLTKSLAVEWHPHRVRLNSVSPGYFATEMTLAVPRDRPEWFAEWMKHTPAGRMGRPDELGPLVTYLLSDASSYLVGQDIVIDGGYTAV